MLFDEIDIVPAVFGKFVKTLYPAYIAFPAWKNLVYGLCPVKERRNREVYSLFPVDLISRTYGDLVKITKHIKNCEYHLGSPLKAAAVS